MASETAMAISKPEHENCTLWYSYLKDGVSDWSDPVDITDEFLRDRTKAYAGSVSDQFSFDNDMVEKERFIMYYGNATTLDKIYLSGLTQSENLVLDVYADDVAEGVIPTTSIVSAQAQTIPNNPRDTGNELINFPETTSTAFMVEISGISGYNGGDNVNVIINGDFEAGDLTGWTGGGAQISLDSGDAYNRHYGVVNGLVTSPSAASMNQSIDVSGVSSDIEFTISFKVIGLFAITVLPSLKVNTGTYASIDIGGSEIGTTVSTVFTVPSSETSVDITFDSQANGFLYLDDISLVVTGSTALYIGDKLDHRAIFFGKQIYQPDYNFNYGAGLDNSAKYGRNQTQTSNYQHKKNSARNHNLTLEHQSDALMDDCEYLDYQLGDGYCFYQRDVTQTDPKYYFLANFSHSATRNDFYNYNSTSLVLQEAYEWL